MTAPMDHLVFVFGTLKQGFPNFATNRGVRVGGVFVTRQPYPLYLVGERHSPWLVDEPGSGARVAGELFRVDAQSLEAMDQIERVAEPDGYRRVLLQVECSETAAVHEAYAYLKPPGQLAGSQIREGPLAAYTRDHAALYRPRAG
jgi:gamma-glutamylaminecyclotransferase